MSRLKHKGRFYKKCAIIFTFVVVIGGCIIYSYNSVYGKGNPAKLSSTAKNNTSGQTDSNLIYSTPWPPTEKQKECESRLSEDRKVNNKVKQLDGVYCGGTGLYISTASDGKHFVFNFNNSSTPSVSSNLNQTLRPTSASYIPSVCTKMTIPYHTSYKNVTYLSVGQTSEFGGENGYREACTPDSNGYRPSDIVVQPFDKTVYVGTSSPSPAPTATPPASNTMSYSQAYSIALNNCAQFGNSSAYEVCISAVLKKYGF
jgi:hypothetical protein